MDCVPLVALDPDQAPDAVQLVAFVDDHVSVELPPLATVAGLAPRLTTGAAGLAETVMVADAWALPPAPEHVSVNALVPANVPLVAVPLIALPPDQAPDAVQLVALVDDHVSTEFPPAATVVGFALMLTVGAEGPADTSTVVVASALPPSPEHVSANAFVAASVPVLAEPLVALAPVHAPDAVQSVASVDDHVRVAVLPLATVCGVAARLTVGDVVLPLPPPQPVRAKASSSALAQRLNFVCSNACPPSMASP